MKVSQRSYLLENDDTYTFKDLFEIHTEKFYNKLKDLQRQLYIHVAESCPMCRDMGHFCLVCRKKDVIFTFKSGTVSCMKCKTCFHKACFNPSKCVACSANKKRDNPYID